MNSTLCRILPCTLFTLLALSSSVATVASPRSPLSQGHPRQTVKKRTVLDYFRLLQSKIVAAGTVDDYLKPSTHSVVDIPHDYLRIPPLDFSEIQIAVFRYHGVDTVAVSTPDFNDYNSFTLYRLVNGTMRDVTKQVMPAPVREDYLQYTLPRHGTTIHVTAFDDVIGPAAANRHRIRNGHAFDLAWHNGRFVKQ